MAGSGDIKVRADHKLDDQMCLRVGSSPQALMAVMLWHLPAQMSANWPESRIFKPAIEVITDFSVRQSGCGPAIRCEPYDELIALELDRGRNAMGIWQDLVDSHGFGGGYQSVLRYVRKLRAAAPPEARAIIETPAGEECQVDRRSKGCRLSGKRALGRFPYLPTLRRFERVHNDER